MKVSGSKLMLLAVIFFAIAHAAVKWLPHIPFYQLVVWRQLIALIICGFALWHLKINPLGKNKRMLLFRGAVGTVALTAYFYTLQNMPLATAVTLQYLSPILTLIIAHFWFREKLTRKMTLYFILAFIGVVLVKGVDARISVFDLLVSMIAVFSSAFAYNSVRALGPSDHELVVVFYFPLVSLPLLVPFSAAAWVWPQGGDWLAITIIGVCTFFAQLFMTQSYQRSPAHEVAIINYLGVIFALIIGYVFFKETHNLISYVGMGLILISIYLATIKRVERSPRSQHE